MTGSIFCKGVIIIELMVVSEAPNTRRNLAERLRLFLCRQRLLLEDEEQAVATADRVTADTGGNDLPGKRIRAALDGVGPIHRLLIAKKVARQDACHSHHEDPP